MIEQHDGYTELSFGHLDDSINTDQEEHADLLPNKAEGYPYDLDKRFHLKDNIQCDQVDMNTSNTTSPNTNFQSI